MGEDTVLGWDLPVGNDLVAHVDHSRLLVLRVRYGRACAQSLQRDLTQYIASRGPFDGRIGGETCQAVARLFFVGLAHELAQVAKLIAFAEKLAAQHSVLDRHDS